MSYLDFVTFGVFRGDDFFICASNDKKFCALRKFMKFDE